jgi:excisionase family DNA binding protein
MGSRSERRAECLLLTPRQVVEILGPGVVGKHRVYSWIRSGRLPSVRDGGRILISREAVVRLAQNIAAGRW